MDDVVQAVAVLSTMLAAFSLAWSVNARPTRSKTAVGAGAPRWLPPELGYTPAVVPAARHTTNRSVANTH